MERLIIKPWGREIWLKVTDNYVMKKLIIEKDKGISLQVHNNKEETMYVEKGVGLVRLNNDNFTISKGDVLHIKPGDIHKVTALYDMIIIEASTPELDDVKHL